jgi:hypothetical protein
MFRPPALAALASTALGLVAVEVAGGALPVLLGTAAVVGVALWGSALVAVEPPSAQDRINNASGVGAS